MISLTDIIKKYDLTPFETRALIETASNLPTEAASRQLLKEVHDGKVSFKSEEKEHNLNIEEYKGNTPQSLRKTTITAPTITIDNKYQKQVFVNANGAFLSYITHEVKETLEKKPILSKINPIPRLKNAGEDLKKSYNQWKQGKGSFKEVIEDGLKTLGWGITTFGPVGLACACNTTHIGNGSGGTETITQYITMPSMDYMPLGPFLGAQIPDDDVTFHLQGNGMDIPNLKPGDRVDLGETDTNNTRYYKISIDAIDAYPIICHEVPVKGTETTLPKGEMIHINSFDATEMQFFVTHFLLGNANDGAINRRADFRDSNGTLQPVKLSYNADARGTGARFTDDASLEGYITNTTDTVKLIADLSNGKVIFDENQDVTRMGTYTTHPTEDDIGQVRVFYDSDHNGVGNSTYPSTGDRVKAVVLLYNPDTSGTFDAPGEAIDGFWEGNQNYSFQPGLVDKNNPYISNDEHTQTLLKNIQLSFRRPAGNDSNTNIPSYRIFPNGQEEFKGWISQDTTAETNQASYQTSTTNK